jgi:hypothetical protein
MHAVGEALLLLGVVTLLLMVTAVTATVFAVRAGRRRYRVLRSRLRMRGLGTVSRSDLPAVRAAAAATVASPAWWAGQHERHRMWRAVSSAQHAVRVAREAGAPVGDLPALCGQLATAAGGVDAVLRASAGDRTWRRDSGAEEVERAALDVQRAALDSLTMVAATDTAPVLSAVRLEVTALAAGVRAAGLAAQRPVV